MAARLAGSWTGYHARVSPGLTALHDLASGRRISYGELEDRVARLTGALAGGFGVRRGDRVAMLWPGPDGPKRTFPPFVAGVGGSPVPAALTEDWARRGVTLRSIYGISEAGACVTITPPGEPAAGPGDVGLPVWQLRCRVADAGGRACAPGEPGELQIAGASVTPGYWGAAGGDREGGA
jgi:acyl-CoA synthetase (AMP-forming)/AMP-acid ligase II